MRRGDCAPFIPGLSDRLRLRRQDERLRSKLVMSPPPRAAALVLLAAVLVALGTRHGASACDSLAVLPSATAEGLGGMYGKNADRHFNEAQPVAVVPRMTHAPGTIITLDSGLVLPQASQPLPYAVCFLCVSHVSFYGTKPPICRPKSPMVR